MIIEKPFFIHRALLLGSSAYHCRCLLAIGLQALFIRCFSLLNSTCFCDSKTTVQKVSLLTILTKTCTEFQILSRSFSDQPTCLLNLINTNGKNGLKIGPWPGHMLNPQPSFYLRDFLFEQTCVRRVHPAGHDILSFAMRLLFVHPIGAKKQVGLSICITYPN